MKRSALINFLVIGGIILVLIILQVALYSNQEDPNQNEETGDRSTYSSQTYGLRGLYLFLEESGYKVGRLRDPYTKLQSEGVKALIVVVPSPFTQPSEDEFKAVYQWVEKGGQLVIVDHQIAIPIGTDIKVSTRYYSEERSDGSGGTTVESHKGC